MSQSNNNGDCMVPLTKLSTCLLTQDPKFYFPNQNKDVINGNFIDTSLYLPSRPQVNFPSSVTNDDTTSSCCSISELTTPDHQSLGAEDHDIQSDLDIRSPDSPVTPTTPLGVNVVNMSNMSWSSLPSLYELPTPQKTFSRTQPLLYNLNTQNNNNNLNQLRQKQPQDSESSEIISPSQTSPILTSPSLSTSSCLEYINENDENVNFNTKKCEEEKIIPFNNNNNNNHHHHHHHHHHLINSTEIQKKNYHRKSKEDIFLKFKLPVNGIATRTRSKKTVPNNSEPSSSSSSSKKKIHLSEEEKVLLKYSNKVANIPPFSRKVTIPSMNPQVNNSTISSQKSSNYPIPKTRQQILLNWTYRDQKKFLASYLSEGKNFGQLAKSLNKSTKEVVEFYYYFKMSPEFRSAKTIKKDLISYSSKLDQITDSITKLKHLSSTGKIIPSPPMRVTFAPNVISSRKSPKRRGRPKKVAHIKGGGIHYYY